MAALQQAPLIAVTGPRRHLFDVRLIRQALRLAGARTCYLSPGQNRPAEQLDGLVIAGGDHIHPRHYHSQPEILARYNPPRDRLELAMLDLAAERGLPVLGICRGAQLINVHRGGDLHQNITPLRKHTRPRRLLLPSQRIHVHERTRLKRISKRNHFGVNRLHSQSIRQLGQGLRIAARDRDQFVQAIESTDRNQWQLGVQWHPEYLLYHPLHRALFKALVGAARRRRYPPTGNLVPD